MATSHAIKADWHAVERDYRAGSLSLREMAKIHGVSHVRIKTHADAHGWVRDLQGKIRAKAEDMLAKAARPPGPPRTTLTVQDERSVIDTNAQVITQVRIAHRQDIGRFRGLAAALMSELEAQTFDAVIMGELGELMRSPDDSGMDRLNDIYKKVISTPGRIDSAKKLIETIKTVIALEREAYSIDAIPADGTTNALASLLVEMKRSSLPIAYEVLRDDSL